MAYYQHSSKQAVHSRIDTEAQKRRMKRAMASLQVKVQEREYRVYRDKRPNPFPSSLSSTSMVEMTVSRDFDFV
jgi:hypothetical protein